MLRNRSMAIVVMLVGRFVFSGEVPNPSCPDRLSSEMLRNFEKFDPLEMTGVFGYFPHRFSGMDVPVYICQFDHWKSGGSFLGCMVSNGIPKPAGCAIDKCEHWEWYRLGTIAGETNLAVIAMRQWGDGSEDAGCDRERFLTVYRNESGAIRASDSNRGIGDLIGDSSFSFLERPEFFFARRDDAGNWSDSPSSHRLYAPSCPRVIPEPASVESESFFEYLRNRTAGFTPATRVVFERDPRNSPFFALASDGIDETEEGLLWSAFLLGASGWEPAPTNGFSCSSGWCPPVFRAKTGEFYQLNLYQNTPRLVVAKNRDGRLEELFWNEAVGKWPHHFDFQKGTPNVLYMGSFGIPPVPISFFQSLSIHPFSSFQRLERIRPATP